MQRASVSSGDVNGDGIPERTFVGSDHVNGDYLRIFDGSEAAAGPCESKAIPTAR